ncbi:DUF983 domain-containing protein [Qingshengfaniella alkalisoli]|uniref:DUF983 domain-containing protein n=1 Tax=Qingshengfaniella alkalisoli TaxID=2599296 RepID=A0A5B8I747_9RHOB|nr:DUF983 domain-containing protein [Qingshengfaniella alkalisoli]QDY69495.1 DUF983 domain-containing protein [Qingshengfaniella alkalisoli]
MHDAIIADPPQRDTKQAAFRGLRCKCPNCGEGGLFQGYLKVRPACPSCGEDLTPQRADDGPAYLVILIVGHILAVLIHVFYASWRMDPLTMAITLSILCVTLSLFLLPRFKGMIIGIQWAKRMHGFGES